MTSRIRISDDVAVDLAPDGGVAVNLETGEYYELNAVGAFVWTVLQSDDGAPKEIDHLVDAVSQTFDAKTDQVRKDLETFVADLRDRALVIPA